MRFAGWFCLVLGVLFVGGAAVAGVQAIQQAAEISAYHNARPCTAGAAANAECLRPVDGSVVAVTEFPGSGRISADYALDVQTASATLHLTFSSDSPMLGYAVDGNPAIVTMWRGVPVSVVTDGRSEATTSVPETSFARALGNSLEAGGAGLLLVFGAWAIFWNRRVGARQPVTNPVRATVLLAVLLTSIVVAGGGIALGGKPSRIGPDLTATGAALLVVIGLSVWLGLSAQRRISRSQASLGGHDVNATVLPPVPLTRRAPIPRTPLRTRLHPANSGRVLGTVAAAWLTPALTVGVLFGVLLTSHDGPPTRAFRHAPECVGETNLATCIGDFTAVINGVRKPANDRSSADVSYVTSDGVINQWGTFDGNSAAIARMATADEKASTPLTIRVWRGSIIGAELGGSWQWTEGNPPGDAIPGAFLSVSFVLLLFVVRLRVHRRTHSSANNRRLFTDDLGLVLAAAGSVVLLADGFWPGAFLALATLVWLGLSARQSARRGRAALTAEHAA